MGSSGIQNLDGPLISGMPETLKSRPLEPWRLMGVSVCPALSAGAPRLSSGASETAKLSGQVRS